jgi:hypothetical protein
MKTKPIRNFITISRGREKNLWRNNIILLVSLVMLIFVVPVFDLPGNLLIRTGLGMVVVSGVFAAEFKKGIFAILLSLALVVLAGMLFTIILPKARIVGILVFLLATSSLVFSTIALVSHVGGSKVADRSTILCAINGYLLIGLTSSILFMVLDLINPDSFANLEAARETLNGYFYYGFITLTTVGYGDITPTVPLARSLAAFTALSGQLYLVIIMALIIGKYLNRKES